MSFWSNARSTQLGYKKYLQSLAAKKAEETKEEDHYALIESLKNDKESIVALEYDVDRKK